MSSSSQQVSSENAANSPQSNNGGLSASAGRRDAVAADDDHESLINKYRVPFYLFLNASSSIGIVFANKVVFQMYNFKYGTLLTLIHFICTAIGLEICRQFGVFEYKPVDIKKVLPLCISFCGFVALTNHSLVYNSVGFYQLIKVLTTPLIVFIQTMWWGETFSIKIKLALALTCVGVAIGSVTDAEANMLGTFIALSALLVTCMYQIWVGSKQKELEMNSYQLLYVQAPISAVLLVPLVPLLDPIHKLVEVPDQGTLTAIFVSSLLAFLVNLSIFLVIGKTSPVTYNVLGHFKLTVILSMGFIIFNAPLDYRNITGILVTLWGVLWYTHLKMQPAQGSEKK